LMRVTLHAVSAGTTSASGQRLGRACASGERRSSASSAWSRNSRRWPSGRPPLPRNRARDRR
jgi:hypothetical protein